jgi:dipeptidyl aminopeptidase/acylaminoacyl peptidase
MAVSRASGTAPWVERFRAPTIPWTALAKAAPMRGLVSSNKAGLYQLYSWDRTTGDLRQLTHVAEGIARGYMSPDGRYVYFFVDAKGNEIGHWIRVPFEGGEPQKATPGVDDYNRVFISFSQNSQAMGITTTSAEGFTIFIFPLNDAGEMGEPRQLYRSSSVAVGPFLAYDARTAVIITQDRSSKIDYKLLAFDVVSGEQIAELGDADASINAFAFSPLPGDTRLLAITNQSGYDRPLIWDPRTNERLDLALAELDGDVSPEDWSPDGNRILLNQMLCAVQRLYTYDLKQQALKALAHPPGTLGKQRYGDLYFASDDEIFASYQNSEQPLCVIALDSHTGQQTRVIMPATDQPAGSPIRSITFASSDGQPVQAWLIVPEGEGPFPTIIETHGGPFQAATDQFSPSAMMWVDHGFAYCTVNYRGSTTFGKEFKNKIYHDLGNWEVEDVVAAHAWLVDNQIAIPNQVFMTGWSYGGFLTLQVLGKYPDLWACGLAGMAVADWILCDEDSTDAFKAVDIAWFGGSPDECPERYRASSPITYAENVRAPILIIQGKNDTATPARQIEVYEQKMRALGKEIDVHWYDAGHGSSSTDVELIIAHHQIMLDFALKVLNRG